MNCLNISTSVISGCLRVNVKECKNPLSARVIIEGRLLLNLTALYNNVNVDINRIDRLNATHSLICNPCLTYNYFLVKEGLFILSNGKKFKVIKDERLSE